MSRKNVISGAAIPCMMPPRPSAPWHIAHPTPSIPWLFSTRWHPAVVPYKTIRRPLSVWLTGITMAPASARSMAPAKAIARTADLNRIKMILATALSKFLDIETQTPEERSIEPGERGVGIADAAQSKYNGVLRSLSRPLDIKEADSPTTVCTDIEEPIIDLRKDSGVFVKVRRGHKRKIVWQDNTHLARIEMSPLLLHQLLI